MPDSIRQALRCAALTLLVAVSGSFVAASAADDSKAVSADAPLITQLRESAIFLGDIIGTLKDLESQDKLGNFEIQDLMSQLQETMRVVAGTVRSDPEVARSLCNNEVIEGLMQAINQRVNQVHNASGELDNGEVIARFETLHNSFNTAVTKAENGC